MSFLKSITVYLFIFYFVDKLTFISIAFPLPVLFRIEHENSCNDPIENAMNNVLKLAVKLSLFPMFQE